ncbi:MAG: AAA family ATPase [Solirubrobacteraceae bacterium]
MGGDVLLEREMELEVLEAALVRAATGSGSVVYVEGPAGIGKSSLLDACRRVAADRGVTVLATRGDALVMESSFAAVRELLWARVRAIGVDRLDGAARLAMPVFGTEHVVGRDRERASAVLHGLYWLVADIAEHQPLVLLIDDAQWLDAASARFIEYLARRCDSLRILVVVALRTGESPAGAEFGAVIRSIALRVLTPRAFERAGEQRTRPGASRSSRRR